MSALDLFDDLLGAAVERAFGETIVLTPQRAAGHAGFGGADPTRPAKTVTGVYASGTDDLRLFVGRRAGETALGNTDVVAASSHVTLTAAVVRSLGYDLVAEDLVIVAADPPRRPGALTFRINEVRADDTGALLLELVPA